MSTTQCLRVARFVPTAMPTDGDIVQVLNAVAFTTRFFASASGGGSLPIPQNEGDVLQADAGLLWIAAPIDGGSS